MIHFPRFIYITQMVFFENLTGKHFYNLAYKLHSTITDLYRMLSYAVCCQKINNATVKLIIFSQQPSSQDLCVNISHFRSKTLCGLENM